MTFLSEKNHIETSGKEILKLWDAYCPDEKYSRLPGYLGICCTQEKWKRCFLTQNLM